MRNEKREKDFAKASAQFDGIHAQVAFVSGCEHGYQYAKKRLIDILEYELDFNVLEYDDGVTTTNLIDKICKRMEE